MDDSLTSIGLKLGEVVVRNTATTVADRITAARTRKKQDETIAELEQLINELVADKSDLIQVAQAYEDELVAQRISPEDVDFISSHVVPLVTSWVSTSKTAEDDESTGGAPNADTNAQLELIKPLLSAQTVTVLQLLGFNFRRAIGEPLTEVVRRMIEGVGPSTSPAPHGSSTQSSPHSNGKAGRRPSR